MKRIICLLIAAILLTGCSGSGKPQQDSALSISQVVQDSQNIELAENFRLNAPEVPLYTFQRTYPNTLRTIKNCDKQTILLYLRAIFQLLRMALFRTLKKQCDFRKSHLRFQTFRDIMKKSICY